MTKIELAVIGGDGIGPEVTAEALKVLSAATAGEVEISRREFNLGAARYHATGEILPDEELAALSECDAILLGAVGDPSVPSGLLERGLLLKLRFSFDHYINLRPVLLHPGVDSPLKNPGKVDFLVVREGTESLYAGNGGRLREGTIHEVATEVSVNTAFGVERVVRYAYEAAKSRRKKLTLVHKHNVLVHAGGLWSRIVAEVGEEYPEVETDYVHIDAATIYLVTDPSRFDVIVTDNLFGDILTDEAGAITGGIGLAASGNINPGGQFPSMFEPVHGSAPDIAGTGTADPVAAISSAALLCSHLGLTAAQHRIEAALAEHMAGRTGESISTAAVGDHIAALVKDKHE